MNNYEEVLFDGGTAPVKVLVSRAEETIWLSLNEISSLYERDKSSISRRINKILANEELTSNSVVSQNGSVVAKNDSVCDENSRFAKKIEVTAADGKVYKTIHYAFDIVVLIGHKIGSSITTLFQNWCLDVLNKNTETSNGDIVIYNNNGLNLSVNVDPKEETVWLNENQIALLFDTTRQNVNLHINNITKENELNYNSVSKESLHTARDGKQYSVTYYNLDMILAVGYRIKSDRAIVFRRWVSDKLKQYLFKGYVIDEQRVKVATCDESCREELMMRIQQIETPEIIFSIIDLAIHKENEFIS